MRTFTRESHYPDLPFDRAKAPKRTGFIDSVMKAKLGNNPNIYLWRSHWETQSVIKNGYTWKIGTCINRSLEGSLAVEYT
ncbi:unnamed protein product [Cuscuta campestris]|uniref:Uncharacterized protein n=1 Tax=Cuscuta campestris TaxID=132261 RepID=A0A484NC37_9ASTE|nr:unnamed protein product [Cuscuta campestris]